MEPGTSPTSVRTIFTLVTLTVVGAAVAGLPLFQDGSSYLLELLTTGSAVRHHRVSALAVQLPAIVARHFAGDAGDTSVPLVRLAFSLGYAVVPLVALGLSWRIVSRTRPDMLIWPALVILFVNLVDFSWVSELLIAIQLACPLLLSALLEPASARALAGFVLLVPFVWWLHPLSATLLATIAVACGYAAWRDRRHRRAAAALAVVYAGAALVRVATLATALTAYESSFRGPAELVDYLFVSHWEYVALLLAALAIAGLVLRGRTLGPSAPSVRRLHRSAMAIAVVASVVLVSQYFAYGHTFPLKTGLVLFTAIAILVCATFDAGAPALPDVTTGRLELTGVLAAVFLAVIAAKGVVWHTAVARLGTELTPAAARCREVGDLAWLHHAPYSIVDNWALPSLALVLQDHRPRTLLLETGDCRRFHETRMVQIDPWTALPADELVPRLD